MFISQLGSAILNGMIIGKAIKDNPSLGQTSVVRARGHIMSLYLVVSLLVLMRT